MFKIGGGIEMPPAMAEEEVGGNGMVVIATIMKNNKKGERKLNGILNTGTGEGEAQGGWQNCREGSVWD